MSRELRGRPDGHGLRIGVVVSRFNEEVTGRLLRGALDAARDCGVAADDVTVVHVPGAFEIPLAARGLVDRGGFDAVVCLGAVIRGETAHFDYVCRAVTDGVRSVMLESRVPMAFGVLTTDDDEQALARSGAGADNKGDEAVRSALEMVRLLRAIREG